MASVIRPAIGTPADVSSDTLPRPTAISGRARARSRAVGRSAGTVRRGWRRCRLVKPRPVSTVEWNATP